MKGQRTRRRGKNVKSHVAVGGGLTDDQPAMQEAVDVAAPSLIEAMSTEIEELREANTSLAAEVEAQGQVIDAIVPVTLKEWDWDAQSFIEVEYPYSIIKTFVDWLREGRQWKESDTVQPVYLKYLRMQESLTDAKNEAAALESAA